ncbi:MAG: hypothetical protein E7456_04325 [Ruminococcaceae bacterium]|nr:hypothetical protein [Oscillospiraceae bacterium]
MKRRILALIMSLVLMIGILPVTAGAVNSGKCGNNLVWTYANNVLTISGEGPMWDYANTTPGWNTYTSGGSIDRVVFEEGVTYIGIRAFAADRIDTVELSASVAKIGDHAFNYGYVNEGFVVDEASRYFSNDEYGILYNSDKTELIYVHDGIRENCIVPESVNSVADYMGAFFVEALIFTGDAPAFSSNAFGNFSSTAYYPEGNATWTANVLKDYGGSPTWVSYDPENPAFMPEGECGDDLEWTYLNNVLIISGEGPMWDFGNTTPGWREYTSSERINRVVIEEGVTYIGNRTFSSDRINTVELPASVAEIGEFAFNYGYVYEGFVVDEASRYFSNDEYGVLYNSDKTELIYIHDGINGQYTVPESVEAIADYAGGWAADKLIFTGDAPAFGNNAFWHFSGTAFYPEDNETWTVDVLQSYSGNVIWASYDPENPVFSLTGECGDNLTWEYEYGVLTISGEGPMWDYSLDDAPTWCNYTSNVDSVVIEEGVTSIGDYAFSTSSSYYINIPASVTEIGEFAFNYGYVNAGFYVDEANEYFSNDEYGVLYNRDKTELIYIHDGIDGEYTVPESVKAIADYAGGWSVEKLIFIGNAPTFGSNAFVNFSGMAYYPEGNATWTSDVLQICDNVVWLSYDPENPEYLVGGMCGDNVRWQITEEGVLRIYGEGEMWSYALQSTSWGDYLDSINAIEIEEGVTTIGAYAFEDIYAEYVNIPASVERIAPSAFIDCYVIGIISVDEDSEYYCSDEYGVLYEKDLEVLMKVPATLSGEYVVPEGVAAIESEAFSSCGVDHITLPETLISIGEYAFYDCDSLNAVFIPENVEIICDLAFADCNNLMFIGVDGGNGYYSSDECGVLFTKDKAELIMAPNDVGESYVMPDGVEVIANYAFSICTSIRSIELADTVEYIGSFAFGGCDDLKSITLPENVRYISDYAFSGCGGLRKIIVEGNNIYFSDSTFAGNSNISMIIFEGNAPFIADSEFEWPDVTVYYPEGNDTWTEELMTSYGDAARFVEYDPSEPSYEGIASQGECGENLTWILDENGILTISGEGAMTDYEAEVDYGGCFGDGGCSGDSGCIGNENLAPWNSDDKEILSVVIEEGVTSIGDEAFNGCENLTEMIVPDSVTRIGADAFWRCSSIKEFTVSEYVTEIGEGAFGYCSALERIVVAEDNQYYCTDENGILFNKDMTLIHQLPGTYAGKYTIPSSVVTINNGAFAYCNGLTEVMIPYGVKTIGASAFAGCESLTELTIPSSVETVGSLALFCPNLIELRFEGDAPEFGEMTMFNDGLTIYYPEDYTSWNDVIAAVDDDTLTWIAYTPHPRGDVDGSGQITNADLVMVARYIVGVESDNDAAIEAKGDVDGDGEIANADLVRIARIIVGF